MAKPNVERLNSFLQQTQKTTIQEDLGPEAAIMSSTMKLTTASTLSGG